MQRSNQTIHSTALSSAPKKSNFLEATQSPGHKPLEQAARNAHRTRGAT